MVPGAWFRVLVQYFIQDISAFNQQREYLKIQ